jgi:hypothetical protein
MRSAIVYSKLTFVTTVYACVYDIRLEAFALLLRRQVE